MKGIVFDIRRFCVHDGPGIRTTVFMKGCPMVCLWCHNPESQTPIIEIFDKSIELDNKRFKISEPVGIEIQVAEVMQAMLKDAVFYDESGGGVTFSGGEPLYQPDFLLHLLMACKKSGLHTVVDTCGHAPPENFLKIIPFTDLFLYDLKHPDPLMHEYFTGVKNHLLHRNLEMLIQNGCPVIIRIPVIPSVNAHILTMTAMAGYLSKFEGRILEINLLPFHKLAAGKYARLNRKFNLNVEKKMEDEELFAFIKIFENEGFKTKIGG
jgi:pyruvate formate lyase activating enzyme